MFTFFTRNASFFVLSPTEKYLECISDLSECKAKEGHCQTDQGTVIWDPAITNKLSCPTAPIRMRTSVLVHSLATTKHPGLKYPTWLYLFDQRAHVIPIWSAVYPKEQSAYYTDST